MTLTGRFGAVTRLDTARHGGGLWQALGNRDDLWTYISRHGPFADERAFTAWLAHRETREDPYCYTILDTNGSPVGLITFLEIRPDMCVIEVGGIVYSPALQRTPLATETQYLLARMPSRRSVTGAMNGNAIHSMPRHGAPPCVMVLRSRAFSAST